jgi:hypothetical protein
MKSFFKVIGAGGMLCLLCALPAAAQIANGVDFTTKFPFYAGNTKLPPGTYKIIPSGYNDTTLMIQDESGKYSAFLEYTANQSATGHTKSEVTFKKYGDTDFLDMIWIPGQMSGIQIDPTKVELKLAASAQPQAHSVPGKPK